MVGSERIELSIFAMSRRRHKPLDHEPHISSHQWKLLNRFGEDSFDNFGNFSGATTLRTKSCHPRTSVIHFDQLSVTNRSICFTLQTISLDFRHLLSTSPWNNFFSTLRINYQIFGNFHDLVYPRGGNFEILYEILTQKQTKRDCCATFSFELQTIYVVII